MSATPRCSCPCCRAQQDVEGNSLIYGSRARRRRRAEHRRCTRAGAVRAGGDPRRRAVVPRFGILPGAGTGRRPPSSTERARSLAGARFIRSARPLVRSSLLAVAVINFFNLMFMAALPAVRGAAAAYPARRAGPLVGRGRGRRRGPPRAVTKRICRGHRRWLGVAQRAASLFAAPIALVPLAARAATADPGDAVRPPSSSSGFGVIAPDIGIGSIFRRGYPARSSRARVSRRLPGDQLRHPAGRRPDRRPARRAASGCGRRSGSPPWWAGPAGAGCSPCCQVRYRDSGCPSAKRSSSRADDAATSPARRPGRDQIRCNRRSDPVEEVEEAVGDGLIAALRARR